MNTRRAFDIVVFGATGFTGRLITRYLASHPQFNQGLFSFAIAARSQSKLHALVQEFKIPSSIDTIQVDVTDYRSVEVAVRSARVVINTVGPYWRWGTPVVKACANNGVHYVDLTGESVWIKDIINQFDYLATKTGAIIVPSCGYDSVPSDISAYLSNKTLKAYGDYDVATSVSGQKVQGGVSGGTLNTIFTILGDIPRDKLRESAKDYSLSPVMGGVSPMFKFLYKQLIPGDTPVFGSFFLMAPGNKKLVQRTFGLLELRTIMATQSGSSTEAAQLAKRERYGPSSTSTPPVHVKTVFKGDRDPGYALTAIMIAESALSLLLPPISKPAPPSKASSLPEGLPDLAKKGGILTPMTAFGDVLITRLVDTGRFAYETRVVGQESDGERRKDV
ncbi:hypothetical protein C0993_010140 [Termitomyces sp. T159_Od127]|nr:hypothetical protein C0993_010140 [Termitomyces sp. T159_Od127]